MIVHRHPLPVEPGLEGGGLSRYGSEPRAQYSPEPELVPSDRVGERNQSRSRTQRALPGWVHWAEPGPASRAGPGWSIVLKYKKNQSSSSGFYQSSVLFCRYCRMESVPCRDPHTLFRASHSRSLACSRAQRLVFLIRALDSCRTCETEPEPESSDSRKS